MDPEAGTEPVSLAFSRFPDFYDTWYDTIRQKTMGKAQMWITGAQVPDLDPEPAPGGLWEAIGLKNKSERPSS